MTNYAIVIGMTIVFFLAAIINLACKKRFRAAIMSLAVFLAAAGGMLIYGYVYAAIESNLLLAILRATLGVCGLFVGKNEFSTAVTTPLFQNKWMQLLYWFIHFCGLYTTASAAITTVGGSALRKLRLFFVRWGHLNIIYGVNADSTAWGQKLVEERHHSVLFIDDHPDPACVQTIKDSGCSLLTDKFAITPTKRFLLSIGIHKGRDLSLYAMHKDFNKNRQYARDLLTALEQSGIPSEQTRLIILGEESPEADNELQAYGNRYGYGDVFVLNEPTLSARVLIQNFPPCNTIHFDENGRATENFEALIIGFGRIGQAVLKNLIMHGQFAGSHFHAAVFAPDYEKVCGNLFSCCGSLFDHYDVDFYAEDARSRKMYEYLSEHKNTLKYIVVCTGNPKINSEITEELKNYFSHAKAQLPIYQCSYTEVRCTRNNAPETSCPLYSKEVLFFEQLDRMAMELNQSYCGNNGLSAEENWRATDYFSRMSSRASADFICAQLRAIGKTEEDVLNGDWELTQKQMQTLGETEHLRWCAFHYTMGFAQMPEETYRERAEQYQREVKEQGSSRLRIGKDLTSKQHACLIPWDELDSLSSRENEVTGQTVDYKQLDINNVFVIPAVLKAARK